MAQVEDHVARNLSQLPDFGVELSSMEFTSVRAFLRLSQVFVFMAGKSNWMWLLIYLCPFFLKKKKKKKFFLVMKQVAGLDGENSRPSRLLEIAANVSYLGADLFDHRAAHFHPLWALYLTLIFLNVLFWLCHFGFSRRILTVFLILMQLGEWVAVLK